MLKILTKLKSIFQKEELINSEKVELSNLFEWFNQKILQLELNSQISQYFQKVSQIKLDLQQKFIELERLQISEKDKQQVEP